ncbi:peptide ABC transporter substrate-binding protein [Paenibacillus glycinis]|uniref:Solute-binding protein family 5 domain-containing protein n=1 Tax=Paenibacillus glycinis TaxID=2697035 RepID=A0ABW9XKE9_9BACL|nr:peptide ABC transporter substrate-binding protein [Paenibacillus glycinis]NBD23031.1 hypothetical protein [Paenibacillus glycinis]
MRENQYGKVVPGMAESWKMSGDGRTYDFKLRAGATWSNGQPVKAGDFEYAWKKTLSPSSQAAYAYQLYVLANAEAYHAGSIKDASKIGVKAINDQLLRMTLTRSTPAFLQMLSWMTFDPVNAANAKQHPDWAEDPETMVTNGPFTLKSWTDDAIVLEKNLSYYAANEISFSEVRMIGDRSLGYGTQMPTERYLKGDYDWIGGIETPDLQSVDRETLLSDYKSFPLGASYYYQFNLTEAPFNNAKIRKALSLAVSRKELGFGSPAFGIIPPSIAGAKGDFRSEVPDTAYFSEESEAIARGRHERGRHHDKYMNQARFTYDPIARTLLYAKAEKLLIDQMVILPLYYYVSDVLSKPYVKGVKTGLDGSVQYARFEPRKITRRSTANYAVLLLFMETYSGIRPSCTIVSRLLFTRRPDGKMKKPGTDQVNAAAIIVELFASVDSDTFVTDLPTSGALKRIFVRLTTSRLIQKRSLNIH